CAPDGALHGTLHFPAIVETHFHLGGMNVHVQRVCREHEFQDHRGTHTGRNGGAVCGFDGANDAGVTKRTTVHDQVNPARPGAHVRRALHESAHVHRSGDVVHCKERL